MYGNLLIAQRGHTSAALQRPGRAEQKSKTTRVGTAVHDSGVRAEVCLAPTYQPGMRARLLISNKINPV